MDDATSQLISTTTLAIIAGGAGTRMGLPKALLQIDGRSMPVWLLDHLQWTGPTMLVTAPAVPQIAGVDRFTLHVVDPVDGLGPLRGVLTALENVTTDLVVTIAVDMPLVDRSKLGWLVTELQREPGRLGLMCIAVVDGETIVEPFPAVYRRDARPIIEQRLASGRRSVHGVCRDDARFVVLPAPADWRDPTWTNLNDRADLARFDAMRGSVERKVSNDETTDPPKQHPRSTDPNGNQGAR